MCTYPFVPRTVFRIYTYLYNGTLSCINERHGYVVISYICIKNKCEICVVTVKNDEC